MRKKINQLVKHPLISGSFVIVVGSMLSNLFNYLYNLGMGRFLTVSEYGTLSAIISLFNIFVVFSLTISTVFSKFSAAFVGQNKENQLGTLYRKGGTLVFLLGLVITLLLIASSSWITAFLNIDQTILVVFVAIALFFSFMSSVTSGILQGLLKFMTYSLVYMASSLSKFIFAVIFVLLGFRIAGATFAIVISTGIGMVFSFLPLISYFRKNNDVNVKLPKLRSDLSRYAIPVLLSNIGLTMIYMMDIILVKHYFSSTIAGQYAALSLMGRSIFFVVAPITLVLFPFVAQKVERRESLLGTLLFSMVIVSIPSVLLSVIYFFFPHFILKIFFPGEAYSVLVPYLGPFSVFIIFYTLSYFLNNYYLSINKIKVSILAFLAAIIEVIMITFFHSNISQIINILIVISFVLTCSFVIYYFVDEKK